MNALDIGIIILAFFLAIRGYIRGMIQEIGSLAALGLATLLGVRFHDEARWALEQAFGPTSYLDVVGFGIIFVATLVVISLLSRLAAQYVAKSHLTDADKLLGLIVGVGKAVVACVLAVSLVVYLVGVDSPVVSQSRLAPMAIQAANWGLERISGAVNQGDWIKHRNVEPGQRG